MIRNFARALRKKTIVLKIKLRGSVLALNSGKLTWKKIFLILLKSIILVHQGNRVKFTELLCVVIKENNPAIFLDCALLHGICSESMQHWIDKREKPHFSIPWSYKAPEGMNTL